MSEIRNKEIGGYLEMETFLGKEYFNDLYRLNLGRTSFVWLLQNIEHERVFLPKFICDSVNKSALDAGFELVSYGLDENLTPLFDKCGEPGGNDILYLVNFYGQLSSDEIKNYKKTYPNIIVDNAQAFYDAPVEGVHTLYSARKFFGLPDGAYVATPGNTNYDSLPADKSQDRVRYLVGRMEDTAREHYSEMLAANETFSYKNDFLSDVSSKAAIPFRTKLNGQLSMDETYDYYKIAVPKKGKLTFNLETNMNQASFSLLNKDGKTIDQFYGYQKTKQYSKDYTLNKGTYYEGYNCRYDGDDGYS